MKKLIALSCFTAVLGAAPCAFADSGAIEATLAVKSMPLPELQKLAETGNAKAQAELGARYGLGQGVTKDYARAIELLRQAAAQNDPDAQYYLGTAYSKGAGVSQDNAQASLWYELAAGQHHPAAEYVMADMIGYGRAGIGRSPNAALYYLWDSATQGYEPAEALLGETFQRGAWIDVNPRAAAYWYRRALSHGPDPRAEAGLRMVLKSGEVDIMPDDPQLDPPTPANAP